jgi:hypothetical protein
MDWQKYEKELVKRWEHTGLLALVEDKTNGALLLESQRTFNEIGVRDPQFNRLSIPLLVRLMNLLQKSGIAVEADLLPLDYELEFPVKDVEVRSSTSDIRCHDLNKEAEDLAKVAEELGSLVRFCVRSKNKNSIKIHNVSLKKAENGMNLFENVILVNCEI